MLKPTILYILSMQALTANAFSVGESMVASSDLAVGIAKFATIVALANSLAMAVAPRAMLKLYKAPTGPMNSHVHKFMGITGLAYGIVLFCSIMLNMPFREAVGYSLIPWVLVGTWDAVTRVDKRLGISPANFLVNVLVGPVIAYLCLTNHPYADTTVKIYSAGIALDGLYASLSPDSHTKAWKGNNPKNEPIMESSIRTLGLYLLAYGLLMLSMGLLHVPVVPAVGLTWICFLLCAVLPLLVPTAKKFSLSKSSIVAWLLPNLIIIAGTTLL